MKLAPDIESPEPIASFPDGSKLVLVSGNNESGQIVVWNWLTGKVDQQILTNAKPRRVIVSPDMKFLAANILTKMDDAGSDDVFLYDLNTGKKIKNYHIKDLKINKNVGIFPLMAFGFSPDSKTLIISEKQNESTLVVSAKSGNKVSFPFTRSNFPQIFSGDCAHVTNRMPSAIGLQVIDVARNVPICTLNSTDPKISITSLALSPASRYLLVRADHNIGKRQSHAFLIDVKSGDVVSVTEAFPNSSNFVRMELGGNGLAFLEGGGFTPRLYRFDNVQGDAFVGRP